jgi:hypothetical protein
MEPIGPITEAFRVINYAEAGLWGVMGVGFATWGIWRRGGERVSCLVAAVVLLAFGASDVVEAGTGAWWHPWWLLVWKGGCVVILLGLVGRRVISRGL